MSCEQVDGAFDNEGTEETEETEGDGNSTSSSSEDIFDKVYKKKDDHAEKQGIFHFIRDLYFLVCLQANLK